MTTPSTILDSSLIQITSSYLISRPPVTMVFTGHNTPSSSHSPPPTTTPYHQPDTNCDVKLIKEVDFFSNMEHDDLSNSDNYDRQKESTAPTTDLDININTGLHLLTGNTSSDQSVIDDVVSPNSEGKRTKHELATTRVELERTSAENQRLKEVLNKVITDYNILEMHLVTMIQQNQGIKACKEELDEKDCMLAPRLFMDSGLAAETDRSSPVGRSHGEHFQSMDKDCREVSPEQYQVQRLSSLKGDNRDTHDIGQSPEATMRRARVSVRARSEASVITDGCQWRKYGQKMAKGNPCPRAYYRCTMATSCPVRKQVQRCAQDKTILITTYEGNHNHPLPPTAMAMAATTSSAARMLLSGPIPSSDDLMNSNYNLSRNFIPCPASMTSISASAPFPTVTLDLTQTPNPLHFQRTQIPLLNSNSLPQFFAQPLNDHSKFSGLQMSQNVGLHPQGSPHAALADTLTALTADPNFTAAVASAISSIMGGGNGDGSTRKTND